MASISTSLQRLNVEAEKAEAAAEAAKRLVRSAKGELKKARKLSKTAKKFAKLARKKAEAALGAELPSDPHKRPKSLKAASDHVKHSAERRPRAKGLPSASQVAKAVITRMSVSGRAKRPAMRTSQEESSGVAAPAAGSSIGPDVIHTASARVDAAS